LSAAIADYFLTEVSVSGGYDHGGAPMGNGKFPKLVCAEFLQSTAA